VILPREEGAHARARRLAAGDSVVLVDGGGGEAEGRIARWTRSGAEIDVVSVRPPAAPAETIWLGVAGVRGERLAWIAEKAGELGVTTLALVRTARTQAFRAGADALARIERLVREAAKQSGAARWPSCEGPMELPAALTRAPSEARLFVDFSGEPFPRELRVRSCAILVGPEGGWTDEERDSAKRGGWRLVALPAATLKTETAAVAAVVLARAAMPQKISR
jgi:16S rRNA (uracil1498-N3)-methyltransferase